jgi:hypothetical protein
MSHGTESAYRHWHCKCEPCREAANRARQRRREAEPREALRAKWREAKRRQRAL